MSQVTAVFYTQAHRIEGDLRVVERLSEKLNDPLTDFIEIRSARVVNLLQDDADQGIMWPVVTIPKAAILLATLDMQNHESGQTRIDKLRPKTDSQVGVIVGSIEVYGTGHLQCHGDPTRVLTSQLQSFFPITDATILLSQRQSDNCIVTNLALINRSMIRAFTLSIETNGLAARTNPLVSANEGSSPSGSGRHYSLAG